jgi:hypothetical protein
MQSIEAEDVAVLIDRVDLLLGGVNVGLKVGTLHQDSNILLSPMPIYKHFK